MRHYKRIYRLEHRETKKGPYQYANVTTNIDERIFITDMGNTHGNDTHPYPRNDFHIWLSAWATNNDIKFFRYGCDSKKKVRKWFGIHYKPLLNMGFVLASYKTTKYLTSISKKQTVFQ